MLLTVATLQKHITMFIDTEKPASRLRPIILCRMVHVDFSFGQTDRSAPGQCLQLANRLKRVLSDRNITFNLF